MIIHIVKQGETIDSIANTYNVPAHRLILENDIMNPNDLVIGQSIVIVYPRNTYTIQAGDTLTSIAQKFQVPLVQLLRNNPYLADREFIYPGETIVITYEEANRKKIAVNGYAYPFINRNTLRKTLPFLTYLTIYNYGIMAEGDLKEVDDLEIIAISKEYGVAPMMLVSALTEQGVANKEIASDVLDSQDWQDRLYQNIIKTLKRKGYYGVNIYLNEVNNENIGLIEQSLQRYARLIRSEGFRFIVSVTPKTHIDKNQVIYDDINYKRIAAHADDIVFLSYELGYSYGPPASTTPINLVKEVFDHIVNRILPDKILLGCPVIGYDWKLPYIPGYTRANALTYDLVMEIAAEEDVVIEYDDISHAPYFFYKRKQDYHIVWFKDSRSIHAILSMIPMYGLSGVSIWNIMRFFAQLWIILNIEYDIEKVTL